MTASSSKSLAESFEQTVSADNLSSGGNESGVSAAITEGGGRENLAAEAVAASVLSQVLSPGVERTFGFESPNDNEALSPLLEVVDNLEAEDHTRQTGGLGNLNLRESLGLARQAVTSDTKQYDNRGLDVVSLASTLASDLAHLVESMNLADRPSSNTNQSNNANMSKNGRPITARTMAQDSGRFSKLDLSTAELSSELNLAFGDSVVTTPTPPPTCNAFSTPTPPPNCPPPPPPQLNNQGLLMDPQATDDEKQRQQGEVDPEPPMLEAHCPPSKELHGGTEPSAVSLLETFAAVARRRATGASGGAGGGGAVSSTNANNTRNTANSLNSGIFGRGGLATNSVSSLVRLALSTNFPSGLLNQAQSYPSLNPSQNNVGQPARQTNEAEQVSMEEFLESCRATSLLAELEDDEELPDADEEENEEDCDDSEDGEDNYDEDGSSGQGLTSAEVRNMFGKRKHWDDDHVLKRKFSALIPAFDPRPGRTNVNQTSDLEVPTPGGETQVLPAPSPREGSGPRLVMVVKGPNLPGVQDIEVELTNPDWTIFRAVQAIVQTASLGTKSDKTRRVWEPTYVIVYREARPAVACSESGSRRNSTVLPQIPVTATTGCSMDEVLQLVRQLYVNLADSEEQQHAKEFLSKKITNKLVTQIQDPLVLSAAALPEWAEELAFTSPFLFPFETRQLFFHCTAFGSSRSIVWLQQQREAEQRGRSGPGMRAPEQHEFKIGRIKHERVKVPRGDQILDWGINVMKLHADRKSILEVEFIDEEGTGLGPTLEFFALVAAELQRADLCMWLSDLSDESSTVPLDMGEKPAGYYVNRPGGLFPAPLPQEGEVCARVSAMFHVLGVFIAKTLQDARLVDLPLSTAFLKLLCGGEVSGTVRDSSNITTSYSPELLEDVMTSSLLSVVSEESDRDTPGDVNSLLMGPAGPVWWAGLLELGDLEQVDPGRGAVLGRLQQLALDKQTILADDNLDEDSKAEKVNSLGLDGVTVEELGMTMQYSPSSSLYQYSVVDLKPGGGEEAVTIHNLEEYVERTLDWVFVRGVRGQLEALRQGFNSVFPIDKLGAFTPSEVRTLLCGDQEPVFTREEILRYTEPKLGYTRDSAGFLRFVNVLVGMTGVERKAFLQFTTGCSSLPPGGLANLHPRLTVVRKIDAGDGSFPSVNTCVHYLKLPDYSSEEVLKEKLLLATAEKGFHLN